MSQLRVNCFTVSVDGYGAGPEQSLERPMGVGGEHLHGWCFAARSFRRQVLGLDDGGTGVDDAYLAAGFENIGAWILGRNMFGPLRGPWGDSRWTGWWGDEPPYRTPVFVLSHHARPSIEMAGGTVFHFVTGGIHEALERAREAARDRDVRLGGGVATLRQYLQAGLVDTLHLAVSPALLGRGESLFEGLDLPQLGYRCLRQQAGENAVHLQIGREPRPA